ncbi:acyltransferase [Pseudomonas migulae]|uniref:Hexapeptide repeat of succinyl-transferase n=1 Tax=Pseudomonas migulae TaxID=78543 RepID=A0A1H5N135_9PSED|nr:acyltransferase [Pseudomonas migulae]SEE94667.1 Hexapeptide repeat of succinyl-transferase [Pseudomonas migulae]
MITDFIHAVLRRFWRARSEQIAKKWSRSVPFGDLISDRWERAEQLGFGEGTSVYDSVLVLGDVKVGRNCWIGPGVILDGSGGLVIGDNCSIAAGAQIYSHDTVQWAVTGGKAQAERQATSIGNNCYIGPNCVIAKGVSIGSGCIIGAASVVLKSVPDNSKAFGVPCRVFGNVEEIK